MYLDYLVNIPEAQGKLVFKRISDTTYVYYEYDRKYISDKGYTIPKRATIGKVCPSDPDLMWPNESFYKFFPEQNRLDRDPAINFGSYLVVRKVIEDYNLPLILSNFFSERDVGLILDIAAYTIVTEGNEGQYYPDYATCHPLFTPKMKVYSDSTVGKLFHSIEPGQILGFLNTWNQRRDHREKIYISYDATNKNSEAGDIDMAEYGHAKDDAAVPIINYSVAYDTHNREPLFYEAYSGSIPDTSEFDAMIGKAIGLGYKKIGFILDRGYFSQKNLHLMTSHGYSYIIMVKGTKKFINPLILKNKGTFEKKFDYYIEEQDVYGITVKAKVYDTDEKESYFHLYYSYDREMKEQKRLHKEIRDMKNVLKKKENKKATFPKKISDHFDLTFDQESGVFLLATPKTEVIDLEFNLAGYFCIVTSDKMTAKDAISIYRSRDESEKLFCADKSFLGNRTLGVYSEESVEGKIFIEFVALIIRCRLYTLIKEEVARTGSRSNYMNVPAAINQLEHIRIVWQADQVYRLTQALTNAQKAILSAFGMNEKYVKQEAKNIGEYLHDHNRQHQEGEISDEKDQ